MIELKTPRICAAFRVARGDLACHWMKFLRPRSSRPPRAGANTSPAPQALDLAFSGGRHLWCGKIASFATRADCGA